MRFFQTFATAAVGLATLVAGDVSFTSTPTSVTAGSSVKIGYTASGSGSVTITLRKGNPNDLSTVSTLTSSASGGSYNWIVPSSLENASDYALEITQGDSVNYSGEFSLSGANPSAVSSASAAASSSSSLAGAYSSSVSSAVQSSSIASIQSIIASYNSTLQNLTSTPAAGTAASMGTGTAMSRNTTFSSASLTSTSGSSSSVPATTTGAGSSNSGSATSATAAATSKGAAAGVVTGGSPLALVLAAVAGVLI